MRPLPTQPKARLIGLTLQGFSNPTMDKQPRAPHPWEGMRFTSGRPPIHLPPDPACRLSHPNLRWPPCGAILDLRLECPSNPSTRSQAITPLVQNLRIYPQAQQSLIPQVASLTCNTPGSDSHRVQRSVLLLTCLQLAGWFFKKIMSPEQLFISVSGLCLLPIFPPKHDYCSGGLFA